MPRHPMAWAGMILLGITSMAMAGPDDPAEDAEDAEDNGAKDVEKAAEEAAKKAAYEKRRQAANALLEAEDEKAAAERTVRNEKMATAYPDALPYPRKPKCRKGQPDRVQTIRAGIRLKYRSGAEMRAREVKRAHVEMRDPGPTQPMLSVTLTRATLTGARADNLLIVVKDGDREVVRYTPPRSIPTPGDGDWSDYASVFLPASLEEPFMVFVVDTLTSTKCTWKVVGSDR